MKLTKTFLITSLLVLFIACGSESSATPVPTPDVEKAVATAVANALATATAESPKAMAIATPTPPPVSASTKVISSIDGIYDWEKYVISKGLRTGIVKEVLDGDTIDLKSGERIRYLEVSTPEIRNPNECYGDEATVKNEELVLGKTIYIQSPTEGKSIDKYGRTLAYIFTDEYFVFLELVKNGYAIVELYAAPNEFYDLLKQAEDDARLNNRGLWGKCNSLTPKPIPVPTATPRPTSTPRTVYVRPTATVYVRPTATPQITPYSAINHIGERGTVCGKIVDSNYAVRSNGSPTFLNFSRPYPNHPFTTVIWGDKRANFSGNPEEYYLNKNVCITGLIESYKGKPQIVAVNQSQFSINN